MYPATLTRLGRRARSLLPARLIFHPDYFCVRDLCRRADAGSLEDCMPVLRERLRRVLLEAVTCVPRYKRGRITAIQCRNEDPFELIKEFPYLTKAELHAEPDAFLSSRTPRLLRYPMSGGGSSGQGVIMWRTKGLADIEMAFLDEMWGRWGWSGSQSRNLRLGDETRLEIDEYPSTVRNGQMLVSVMHLTDQWLPEIYRRAKDFAPQYIHGYASGAAELARFIIEHKLPPLPVRGVLLISEPILESQLPALHAAFQAPVSITYGLTERTNLAEAVIDPGQRTLRYKVNPIYAYQENFRHDDGHQEIVGTSYWNTVMPLIRYRTGDYGRIENGYIERLEGRDIEYLVTKQGERLFGIGSALPIDLAIWQTIAHLQIFQPRAGEAVVRIVPKPTARENDLAKVLSYFQELWRDIFDTSMVVVDRIEKTPAGKTRLVLRAPGVSARDS